MATRLTYLLDAFEGGDNHALARSALSFLDLTRWRRRPPTNQMTSEPATLGKQIRHARIARGMSQAAATRRFAVSRGKLRRQESGAAPVPRARLEAARRFLARR